MFGSSLAAKRRRITAKIRKISYPPSMPAKSKRVVASPIFNRLVRIGRFGVWFAGHPVIIAHLGVQ